MYTVCHFNYSDVKTFIEKTGNNKERTKKVLGMKGKRETETETEERKKSFQSVVQR